MQFARDTLLEGTGSTVGGVAHGSGEEWQIGKDTVAGRRRLEQSMEQRKELEFSQESWD